MGVVSCARFGPQSMANFRGDVKKGWIIVFTIKTKVIKD
jgi:hypothetical protein